MTLSAKKGKKPISEDRHGGMERSQFASDEAWIAYLRGRNKVLSEVQWALDGAGSRLSGCGWYGLCNRTWAIASQLRQMRRENNEEICKLNEKAKQEREARWHT
jgi:hypothetical protein